MKKFILAVSFSIGLSAISAFAASTPSLGTAGTYGVLAHNFTYANSGTTITGNLGYSITSGTGAPPSVSGATHAADAAYTQAGADQATALAALNSQPCTVNLPVNVNLATDTTHGPAGIYTPGVYCMPMSMSATIGAGGITLSGAGTYIFRLNGSLVTADHSTFSLTNGASACNVFWTVTDNAITSTLGAYSQFAGNLFDTTGLAIKDHMTMTGRALVFGGFVSVNEKDTIAPPTECLPPPPATATLHVIKVFYNDYGGNAVPFDATIHVKNGSVDVAGSPQSGSVAPGTAYTLSPGTYTVSENPFPGYSAIYGNDDCSYGGVVTLAAGDDKTCTVSNDQNPPTVLPATLRVIKHVINNDGGTAVASDFTLHVKGMGGMGMSEVAGSPASGTEMGKTYTLTPGNYAVSEDTMTGYTQSFSGDCDFSGNVTLPAGGYETCTITNDDTAVPPYNPPVPYNPPPEYPATLHVIKVVINDDGGLAVVSDALIHVKNGAGEVSGSPHAGASGPGGTTYTLAPGAYTVSENAMTGYTSGFSGDCDANGKVTLAASDNKKCTVTNNDAPHPPDIIDKKTPPASSKTATLHVIKKVINDNGGTAVPGSFTLNVKHGLAQVTGSPAPGTSAPGKLYTLAPGAYAVSENFFAGYTKNFSGDCDAKGKVTLALGDDKTCTVTNDDTGKPTIIIDKKTPPPVIHVVKTASPVDLPLGGGEVTYRYTVTNTGKVPLVHVTLTDDKCSPILGPSGDKNVNQQLDMTEKWTFTCKTTITHTTRNTVIATGSAGGATVTDKAEARVTVKAPSFPDTAAGVAAGIPARVKIPGIKVDAPIHAVGYLPGGAMAKPSGPGDVVWYQFGTRPGDIGTAVIAGHFGHWLNGSGSVFDRLHELKVGDKVTMVDDQGVVTTFVVRETRLYNPTDDTSDIFDSDDGLSHLNIITCSGTFNKATKSFPQRLVVFTDKVMK